MGTTLSCAAASDLDHQHYGKQPLSRKKSRTLQKRREVIDETKELLNTEQTKVDVNIDVNECVKKNDNRPEDEHTTKGDFNDVSVSSHQVGISDESQPEAVVQKDISPVAQCGETNANNSNDAVKDYMRSDVFSGSSTKRLRHADSSSSLTSTNEDHQGTLKELSGLQQNVDLLAKEKEEFGAERLFLLESLYTQNDKLQAAQTQIEHLKALIFSDTKHNQSKQKQELVSLLKNAIEEKEHLLDLLAADEIKLERCRTQRENKKQRELQLQEVQNKSESDKLLESTRNDKEHAERLCAELQESLAHSNCEITKLKEKLQSAEQENEMAKINNQSSINDLEFTINKLKTELKNAKYKYSELEKDVKIIIDQHEKTSKEWDQQERDLLTVVKVANELNESAQSEKKEAEEKYYEAVQQLEELKKTHELVQNELERMKVFAQSERKAADEKHEKAVQELKGLKKKHESVENEAKRVKNQSNGTFLPSRDLLESDHKIFTLQQGSQLSDLKTKQIVKSLIQSFETEQESFNSSTGSSPRGSIDSIQSLGSPRESPERHNGQEESLYHSAVRRSAADDKQRISRTVDNGISSLLAMRSVDEHLDKTSDCEKDPLAKLVKQTGGTKRNALIKWCQEKTAKYSDVDIQNFSTSFNDGLAFCAILHNYIPEQILYDQLVAANNKEKNFTVAFQAAASAGVPAVLSVSDMLSMEKPKIWKNIYGYVTNLYAKFDYDNQPKSDYDNPSTKS